MPALTRMQERVKQISRQEREKLEEDFLRETGLPRGRGFPRPLFLAPLSWFTCQGGSEVGERADRLVEDRRRQSFRRQCSRQGRTLLDPHWSGLGPHPETPKEQPETLNLTPRVKWAGPILKTYTEKNSSRSQNICLSGLTAKDFWGKKTHQ